MTAREKTNLYPLRAPKSRVAVAKINRLLDEALSKLRLGALAERKCGPKSKNTSPGLSMASSSSNDAFDIALSNLLTNAYTKTEIITTYIDTYSGMYYEKGDVDRAETKLENLTMRQRYMKSVVDNAEAERRQHLTEMAAREVLGESRLKRIELQKENSVLRSELQSLYKKLKVFEDEKKIEEQKQEEERRRVDVEEALEANKVKHQREEREAAGLPEPRSLDEAEAEIQRLKNEIIQMQNKADKSIDYLLATVEKKKSDISELNNELGNLMRTQRGAISKLKENLKDVERRLGLEEEMRQQITIQLNESRVAECSRDWIQMSHAQVSAEGVRRSIFDRGARRNHFLTGPLFSIIASAQYNGKSQLEPEESRLIEINRAIWLAYAILDFKLKYDDGASTKFKPLQFVSMENALDLFFLDRHTGMPGKARSEAKNMLKILSNFKMLEKERRQGREGKGGDELVAIVVAGDPESPDSTQTLEELSEASRLQARMRFLSRLFMLSGHRTFSQRTHAILTTVLAQLTRANVLKNTFADVTQLQDTSTMGISIKSLVSRRHALAALLLSGLPTGIGSLSAKSDGIEGGGKSPTGKKKAKSSISPILADLTRAFATEKVQVGDTSTESASSGCEPIADIYFDRMSWCCPLLAGLFDETTFCDRIHSFLRSVERLKSEYYDPSSGHIAIPTGIESGELCIDLDHYFYLLVSFLEKEAEERLVELESLFRSFGKNLHKDKRYFMQSKAREEDDQSNSSPISLCEQQHYQAIDSPQPNPECRLSYNTFMDLMLYIKKVSSKAISQPNEGATQDADCLRKFRYLHWLAKWEVFEEDCSRATDIHEFLRDPEVFAVSCFREDLFPIKCRNDPLVLIETDPIRLKKYREHDENFEDSIEDNALEDP